MEKFIEMLNKFVEKYESLIAFFVVIVWFFAAIGCAATCFYYGEPQFGVASIINSLLAFPVFWNALKKIM